MAKVKQKARSDKAGNVKTTKTRGKPKTSKRRNRKVSAETVPKNQDFVQAISIKLINGLVVTGTYIGPQKKLAKTRRFL